METGKNKKRPHLVLTESDSSEDSDSDSSEDSLEQLDTKVATHSNLQNGENENERKRRLDVFEFDEYDNIDEKRMKSSLKIEESDNNYEKRTKKKFDKTTSSSARKKELSDYSVKSRSKIDDDSDGAGELPISSLRQKFHSPPKKSHSRKLDFEDKKVSKSVEITKKNKSVSFSSESKVKVGKTTMKSEKVKSHEKVTPVRGSDLKNNRGSSTEKQKLREKLKNLLLDAGWKIDYRPRKSRRDYLDAVYMSPTGSAYWSIVKAYNAFRKHIDSDVEMEDIKKLTRRTQRKIERDMKMKSKKEDSDEDSVSDDEEDENSNFVAKKNIESMKRNIKRCTLLVRSSEKGLNSENERYIAYTGKRTLISWLIDSKIINLSEKVKYMNKKTIKGNARGLGL